MAALINSAWQGYQFLFDELADPRTKDWFLVAKPYQLLSLLGIYLMFVLKWGPQYMKNRQPFNLDKVLIVYNGLQIVACLYLLVNALKLAWGWGGDYKWICQPVDFSNEPKPLRIASMVYFYYQLKIIDLLDTNLVLHIVWVDTSLMLQVALKMASVSFVFFVLRKKYNQVSFLHIYHHTGMCLLIWAAATYLPGGHGTLVGVINSFVHIVMYSYYLLTVAVPSTKNAIWLKKHVTQLQILQFFWCVVHMAIIVFKPDCEFPRWTSAVFLPQNLFMLVLFIDFYIKTYIKKPRQQLKAQMNANKGNNQNNDRKDNGVPNNEAVKAKFGNGINKFNDKEINEAKNYLKNDLSKLVNGNDVAHNNNNNDFCENKNYIENGKKKSTCGAGKCKMNCHKQFKNE